MIISKIGGEEFDHWITIKLGKNHYSELVPCFSHLNYCRMMETEFGLNEVQGRRYKYQR